MPWICVFLLYKKTIRYELKASNWTLKIDVAHLLDHERPKKFYNNPTSTSQEFIYPQQFRDCNTWSMWDCNIPIYVVYGDISHQFSATPFVHTILKYIQPRNTKFAEKLPMLQKVSETKQDRVVPILVLHISGTQRILAIINHLSSAYFAIGWYSPSKNDLQLLIFSLICLLLHLNFSMNKN